MSKQMLAFTLLAGIGPAAQAQPTVGPCPYNYPHAAARPACAAKPTG